MLKEGCLCEEELDLFQLVDSGEQAAEVILEHLAESMSATEED